MENHREGLNQTWWEELMWHGQLTSEDGTKFCEAFPYRSSSYGAWERLHYGSKGMGVWEYSLPNLEIRIVSMFVLWRFFDIFFKKLGIPIPKFSSMMLAGVVLSEASLMGRDSVLHQIFFLDGQKTGAPETIGAYGFVFFWFLRGVTIDVGMLKKTGKRAWVIGFSTLVSPFVLGLIFSVLQYKATSVMDPLEYATMAFSLTVTPFTGINILLRDLKLNHTEFGRIAQASAMVTDLIGLVFSFFLMMGTRAQPLPALLSLVGIFFLLLYLTKRIAHCTIKRTPEGRPVNTITIHVILLFAYLAFHFWKSIMGYGPFGFFILGLAVPDGPPLGSAIAQRFDSLNIAIFLPLLASLGMLQLDWTWLFLEFRNFMNFEGLAFEVVSMILFVCTSKFAASMLSAFASKMPLKDSATLALVLSNRSCFDLAYLITLFEGKLISREVFSITGAFILLNSLFTPLAIHLLYDRSKRFTCYGKRNLMSLKPKAELRAMVCINKADNITSMINFLKASYPSEDYPMSCYVLHLVELVGQATPTFISHQLQKPKPGSRSFSDNVISSFQSFQRSFPEWISIQMFTSVSPAKDMHEDVCLLSLDRSVSLILLPFHRTWTLNGATIVSQDDNMRKLNRFVLKRAPCSVGILVYRKPIWHTKAVETHIQICLIFVGGNDDREALAFAKRVRRRNQKVSITLMRFIPASGSDQIDEWSKMLDTVNLKEFMREGNELEENADNPVAYTERTVPDGTQTSKILQTVAFDYDLFIVGRSSGMGTAVTSGLSEWVEFSELGVLGDFLTSEYYPSRTSVLVVQQQECTSEKPH